MTHDSLIELTDTLIQQNGYQGFSYADLADGLGIRKASIHYHFQTKTDLGLAYCEYKEASLLKLEAALLQLPPGKARLQGYMDAFLKCADSGQMCGIHAMGRPVSLLPLEYQELVIGFGDSGYVMLYRHDRETDRIVILTVRHQKEAGYHGLQE